MLVGSTLMCWYLFASSVILTLDSFGLSSVQSFPSVEVVTQVSTTHAKVDSATISLLRFSDVVNIGTSDTIRSSTITDTISTLAIQRFIVFLIPQI